MTDPLAALRGRRQARDRARAALDRRLARVRGDLDARGIGSRIVRRLGGEALASGQEALAVARESKGVIAGTAAALALWLAREPLLARLGAAWRARTTHGADQENDEDE